MTHKHIYPIIILIFATICSACHNEREEVVKTYPDGSPQLVYRVTGSDKNKVKTAETRYYANGNKQYEKFYDKKTSRPTGTWHYYYDNGRTFANGNFDSRHPLGTDWEFFNTMGQPYYEGSTDSVRVLELSEMDTPATVCFYHGDHQQRYQFYSTCSLRSEGVLVNGLREGEWKFYFSNGLPQTEATFVGDKEEGTYIVYRENGVPYYRGQYHEGIRTGTWEVYDETAQLVATQQY